MGSERITLQAEIADLLREGGNAWMTTSDIAMAVNSRGRFHKQDGSEVTAFQVRRRTRNYAKLFERQGSRVRLRAIDS